MSVMAPYLDCKLNVTCTGPKAQLTKGWLRHSAFPFLIGHSMIYRRGSSLMDTL